MRMTGKSSAHSAKKSKTLWQLLILSGACTIFLQIIEFILSLFRYQQNASLGEVIMKAIITSPILFFFFYIVSGLQVLVLGLILRAYGINLLNEINIRKSNWRNAFVFIIVFSVWIVLNLMLWEFIGKNVRLG